MSNRQVNSGLTNKWEVERHQTINKVRKAIRAARDSGYEDAQITIPIILSMMPESPVNKEDKRLSRSVMSKPHVEEVLKEERVGQFAIRKVISKPKALESELRRANLDIQKLESQLNHLTEQKLELENTLNQKKHERLQMLSVMQQMYTYALNRGVDLGHYLDKFSKG